jgi:hypothetical protein
VSSWLPVNIYKEDSWICVCLIYALNLLLNVYLLDKWIGICNIKYDTLLHEYLWSRAQNSQTYTNIYDIICILDHIFRSSSMLFTYVLQYRILHEYLWSRAQNSQTYTNIYDIICILDHIFRSSSILFTYLLQFKNFTRLLNFLLYWSFRKACQWVFLS